MFYYPEWDIARWDEREVVFDKAKGKKQSDAAFDQLFRNLHGAERKFALSLLGNLFPKVNTYRDVRGLGVDAPSESEADKNKRIYHPEHFSTYFSLHVQEGYISSQELNGLIASANEKATAPDAEKLFTEYLHSLKGLKRYRFLEKMMRTADRLGLPQARALASTIALESSTLAHDEFDMGEFGTAVRLELVLANRFNDSPQITAVLSDVISRSTSDSLVQRVFHFATQKENNQIFENWEFVDAEALKTALAARMNKKYFAGGDQSIYADKTSWKEWQALIWWAHVSDKERENVREYLADEFERRPASIGKHILWLTPSLSNPSGEKVVDGLFPLSQIAELAKKQGSRSYSTESEKNAVINVIEKYSRQAKSATVIDSDDISTPAAQ